VTVVRRDRVTLPLMCMGGEVRQALAHVLSNALGAVEEGSTIWFRLREGTDKAGRRGVWITVADNGAGIAKEDLPRVFEAFFSTKGVMGTGLGLWITREIVVRHQGVLALRSRNQGPMRGTVVRIFLPYDILHPVMDALSITM
jgi:signal transduction histidine kinase